MLKKLLIRGADSAMIALLVMGSADARTFVAVVAGLMAFVAFVSWFTAYSPRQAQELGGSGWVYQAVGWVVPVAYAAALVYAAYPTLAAFYIFAVSGARLKAIDTLKKAQSNESN